MKRWSYVPPNETIWKGLRKHDITSTESAALFGMSPYLSHYQLYHRKRTKDLAEIDMNDRMLWGKFMENTIARGIATMQGIKVRKMNQYIRIVDARMGSSFDFEIIGLVDRWEKPETPLREMYRTHGTGVFEIKMVDYLVFRDNWTVKDDGTIEAPQHIEVQVQHQLHVCGRKWSAIGLLVNGNTPKIVIRERFEDVGNAIEGNIRALWHQIAAGQEPEPAYHTRSTRAS
jgi:putative phage-type endonuclease